MAGAAGGREGADAAVDDPADAVGVAEGAGFEEVEDGAEGVGGGDVGDVGEVLAEEPVAEGGGAEGDGLEGADVGGARDVGVGAVVGGGEDFDVFDDAGDDGFGHGVLQNFRCSMATGTIREFRRWKC